MGKGPAESLVALVARLALAAAFASAVADRFGVWGAAGTPGVAWGSFKAFEAYTGQLNGFVPVTLVPVVAWAATALEGACAALLVVGFLTRVAAIVSAGLLAAFAVTMTIAFGPKPALDYSVWTALAAALVLVVHGPGRWSLDARGHASP